MLRYRGRRQGMALASASAVMSTTRNLGTTSTLRQLQHREEILGTHGAGYVNHESMATANIDTRFHRNINNAAAAADLFRTPVHQGLGTGPQDPYQRTLPNQQSMAPESTVLVSAAAASPTLDEVAMLPRKWASLQYWIGDRFPRLPLYLKGLLVPDALPVSATAERLLGDFESKGIPSVMEGMSQADQAAVAKLWREAVRNYGNLSATHVFDRREFVAALEALHAQTADAMTAICPREGVTLALEVLRRKAILKRNFFIEQGLLRLIDQGPYYGGGDAVWRVFFQAVEHFKRDVLGGSGDEVLAYTWEATVTLQDALRTPAVSAPVALYLVLLSVVAGRALATGTAKAASARVDDDGRSSGVRAGSSDQFALINPVVKRRFVAQVLGQMLAETGSSKALSRALRDVGLHDLSRETALCEAMSDSEQFIQADAAALVPEFESTSEVKTLLSSLMQGTNDEARRHVASTFGIPANSKIVDWERVLVSVDWETNWQRLAAALLSNKATLEGMAKLVKNAIGAKGVARRIFSVEYAEKLETATRAREQRSLIKKEKVDHIVTELSSYQRVDQAVELVQVLGADMTALEEEVVAMAASAQVPRQEVEPAVMQKVLEAIGKRHPSWIKAGVLRPGAALSPEGDAMVIDLTKAMVRMFLRVTHVPQVGAAVVAKHTRRRIGAIGTEPWQFNIPAELGHVEQYDNLQYKRYDWQGWYQRMVDVHNRNVSMRCRIDDLKRLDARGNPFVDMQTERRLRILCEDRVGMGVLKLDSDKYEDQADNITHGSAKMSEIFAESRKAQLGPEYWPSVEVKVRNPSGQSKTYYSTIDYERIEDRSKELYEKYRDAKKRSLFVTPMDMWLEVKGMQVRKTADTADADGYTVDNLHQSLDEDSQK